AACKGDPREVRKKRRTRRYGARFCEPIALAGRRLGGSFYARGAACESVPTAGAPSRNALTSSLESASHGQVAIVNVNVLPTPGSLWTVMSPPSNWASRFEIVNPRPVPAQPPAEPALA